MIPRSAIYFIYDMHVKVLIAPDHCVEIREPPVIPSASKLNEGGIKFRLRKASVTDILDIKFEKGVLEIPRIIVWE